MREPGVALADPLLHEPIHSSACCGWKILVFLSLFIVLDFAALLIPVPYNRGWAGLYWSVHEPVMAVQLLHLGARHQPPHTGKHYFRPLLKQQSLQDHRQILCEISKLVKLDELVADSRASHPSPRTLAIRGRGRFPVAVHAEGGIAVSIPKHFTKVFPHGDKVLVKVLAPEESFQSAILRDVETTPRMCYGEVTEVGNGPNITLKPGDTVIYPRSGSSYTNIIFQDADYIFINEADILGTLPGQHFNANDVPQINPLCDRVLVKFDAGPTSTSSFHFLPSAQVPPALGEVVRVGPRKGAPPEDIQDGDKVYCYASNQQEGGLLDPMIGADGTEYRVLKYTDIFAKA